MLPLSETLKARPRANSRPARVMMNGGKPNLPIRHPWANPMNAHAAIGTTMPAAEPHWEL